MRHMASHDSLEKLETVRVKGEPGGDDVEDFVVVEVFQGEEQYEDEQTDVEMEEEEIEEEIQEIVEESDNYTLTESKTNSNQSVIVKVY